MFPKLAGKVLTIFKRWKLTITVSVLLIPAVFATIVLSYNAEPRGYSVVETISGDHLVEARNEAMQRSTHFEQLMVALGSFELGILAYLGGILIRGKSYISRPKLFFYLSILLLAATTGAYMHVWRIYISYGIYAVKLELLGLHPILRVTTEVFNHASKPNLDSTSFFLQLPANASTSISIVSFYPIFVLSAAILAFGKRFGIKDDTIVSMMIVVLTASIIYVFPDLFEFTKLVTNKTF